MPTAAARVETWPRGHSHQGCVRACFWLGVCVFVRDVRVSKCVCVLAGRAYARARVCVIVRACVRVPVHHTLIHTGWRPVAHVSVRTEYVSTSVPTVVGAAPG